MRTSLKRGIATIGGLLLLLCCSGEASAQWGRHKPGRHADALPPGYRVVPHGFFPPDYRGHVRSDSQTYLYGATLPQAYLHGPERYDLAPMRHRLYVPPVYLYPGAKEANTPPM